MDRSVHWNHRDHSGKVSLMELTTKEKMKEGVGPTALLHIIIILNTTLSAPATCFSHGAQC